MLEDEILTKLQDNGDPSVRVAALEELKRLISQGQVFSDVHRLFRRLELCLKDSSNTVVYSCTNVLCNWGYGSPDMDGQALKLFPSLLANLAHRKVEIRKISESCLKVMLTQCGNSTRLVDEIIRSGLQSENWKVRKESCELIQMEPTTFIRIGNPSLLPALASRLRDVSGAVITNAAFTIAVIRDQMEPIVFKAAVDSFDSVQKKLYETVEPNLNGLLDKKHNGMLLVESTKDKASNARRSSNDFVHGIIPKDVANGLNDSEDWKKRAAATEALQELIANLEDVQVVLPHIIPLTQLLVSLSNDANIKIILISLNIMEDFISLLGSNATSIFHLIDPVIIQRIADERSVIRHAALKVVLMEIKINGPAHLFELCTSNLKTGKESLQEACINIVTLALFTSNAYAFDFQAIINSLVPFMNVNSELETGAVFEASMDCLVALAVLRKDKSKIKKELEKLKVNSFVLKTFASRLEKEETWPKLLPSGLVEHQYKKTLRPGSVPLSGISDRSINQSAPNSLDRKLGGTEKTVETVYIDRRVSDVSLLRPETASPSPTGTIKSKIPQLRRQASILRDNTKSSTNSISDNTAQPVGSAAPSPILKRSQSVSRPANTNAERKNSETNEVLSDSATDKSSAESTLVRPVIKKSSTLRSFDSNSPKEASRPSSRLKTMTLGRKTTKPDLNSESIRARGMKGDDLFKALEDLKKSKEWEDKVEALNTLRFILEEYPEKSNEILKDKLNDVCVAVEAEVHNLRTQVSRAAIGALEQLFSTAGKLFCAGGPSLDLTVHALLKKTGESVGKESFMAEDLEKAFQSLCLNQGRISPIRVVLSFASLAEHKNAAVRAKVAQNISDIMSQTTASSLQKLMQNTKDSQRLLSALSKLSSDGLPETRSFTKTTLTHLDSNVTNFLAACSKIVSSKEHENIKKALAPQLVRNGSIRARGSTSTLFQPKSRNAQNLV
ncbi:hypothetical protein MP638_000660 [Amoeboaphelidium occidentale]|nr:hypothetical protein MP638_000660 [Amoeboaphelidium occidentale]